MLGLIGALLIGWLLLKLLTPRMPCIEPPPQLVIHVRLIVQRPAADKER